MKRLGLFIMAFLIGSLSASADETARVIAPKSLDVGDIHVIAMDGDGNTVNDSSITVTKSDYYGDAGLFKIDVSDSTGKVKLVMGYELSTNNYVLLASEDVYEDAKIDYNYKNMTNDELINIIKVEDYNGDYDAFPGYEVEEGTIILGIKAGEDKVEDSDVPSNIVEKFTSENSDGAANAAILPSNSHTEFIVEPIDPNDPTYVFKKDNDDPETYIEITKGDDLEITNAGTITIRPQSKDQQIVLNGKIYILNPHNQTYTFTGDFDIKLTNVNGNNWIVGITGTTDDDINLEEKGSVYAISGEGMVTKGTVDMYSKSEDEQRQRISDVNLEVMEQGESGFDIKTISK